MFFGMEIYNDSDFHSIKNRYGPLTRRLAPQGKVNSKNKLKNYFRPYYRKLKPNLPFSKKEIKKAVLNNFDYIGIVYKEEYYNILKKAKIKKPNYLFFTYYPLELIVNTNNPINSNKKKVIMIGNSGHLTNNHFDVFQRLKRFDLNEKEITLPLGYGDLNYIKTILNNTEYFFDCKVNFITEFLNLEDYNKILSEVSVFILYTKRQQGIGNIISLLWHGAKVFLSKKNSFYHYLKRIGVHVYCYERQLNQKSIDEGLSKNQIINNRDILYKHLNEKYVINKTKKEFQQILNDK